MNRDGMISVDRFDGGYAVAAFPYDLVDGFAAYVEQLRAEFTEQGEGSLSRS